MTQTSRRRAADDAREDFVSKNWPILTQALEANYGSLRGRLDVVEQAVREHTWMQDYGPHLHVLQIPNLAFGVTDLPSGLGWWMSAEHAIVLDRSLNAHERRSVLAHLLVHAERGEPSCRATWMHQPAIAQRCSGAAQATAAERLIDFIGLARAIHSGIPVSQIAHHYEVAEETVHVRLDTFTARQRQLLALLLEGDELKTRRDTDAPTPGQAQMPLFVRQAGQNIA